MKKQKLLRQKKIRKLLKKGKFSILAEFKVWKEANKKHNIPVSVLRKHINLTKSEWNFLLRAKT